MVRINSIWKDTGGDRPEDKIRTIEGDMSRQ